MKATSKLISVVLILAMCLSLFATSAFASFGGDDQIVIGGSNPGGNSVGGVFEDGYSSQEPMYSGLPAADGDAAGGSEGEAEKSGAAIVRDGVETKYDTLTAALAAAEDGDTVKLYSKELSYTGALVIGKSITLDLNGKTINFESEAEKPAAIIVDGKADVVIKNGRINLVGKAAEGESAAKGFQDVYSANDEDASVQLDSSLNVVRMSPEQWAEANKPVNTEKQEEAVQQPAQQSAGEAVDNTDDEEEQEQLLVMPGVTNVGEQNPPAADENQNPPAADENQNPPVADENQNPPAGEEGGEEGEGSEANIVTDDAQEGEGEGEDVQQPEEGGEEGGEEGEGNEADIVTDDAQEGEGEDVQQPAEGEGEGEDAQQPAEGEGEPAAEGETDPAAIEEEGEGEDLEVNEEPVNITEEDDKPAVLPERVDGDNSGDDKTVTVSGVDSVTGAEVTVTLKGKNPPEGLIVSVSTVSVDQDEAEDAESFMALDITLMLDGEEYHMQEHKEDVSVATVYVSHPDLAGKDVVVEHIVENADGSTYQKTENSAASTDEGVVFNTTGFSTFIFFPYEPAGNTDSALSGSDGDVHHKEIKIKNVSGEIWKKDPGTEDLVFEISGGAAPSSISIVDPEYASSGDAEYYKAGVLRYITDYTISPDPSTDPTADPFTVTIPAAKLDTLPQGKWAVVFWFQDKTSSATTPVYIIKPIYIVPIGGIFPVSPLEDDILTFEKCDYTPVQIKITDELKSLSITKGDGKASVTFDLKNKTATVKTVDLAGNPKTLKISAGGAYEVTEYTSYDPVNHAFVSGKSLNIYAALLKWLPFGNDYKINVETKDAGPTSLPLHIVPGISVADGMTDYIKGKNSWIKFVACAPIDYDLDGTLAISIGGQKISHDYYSISNDHMTLWIYRNLLDQLRSNNSYTLTARLWMLNGPNNKITWSNRTAQFNILAAGSTSYKSPKTGDSANVGLWAAVLVVSGAAVVALIPKKKRF